MTLLRLGAHHLSPAETGLIRALVRLIASGGSADFRWAFADLPPYDAVVAEHGHTPPGAAKPVLYLHPVGSDVQDPNFLVRPVRVNLLESWLLKIQHQIERDSDDITHPVLSDTLDSYHCYKLRRWPPNQLLHRNPQRIRMATFLSRRPLMVTELAKATDHPLDDCQIFVTLLQQMDLVDITQPQVAEAQPPAQPPAPAPSLAITATEAPEDYPRPPSPPPPAPRTSLSLVRSIRQRLGL